MDVVSLRNQRTPRAFLETLPQNDRGGGWGGMGEAAALPRPTLPSWEMGVPALNTCPHASFSNHHEG